MLTIQFKYRLKLKKRYVNQSTKIECFCVDNLCQDIFTAALESAVEPQMKVIADSEEFAAIAIVMDILTVFIKEEIAIEDIDAAEIKKLTEASDFWETTGMEYTCIIQNLRI